MKMSFENLRVDGDITNKWDVLLRIVGEFAVRIDGEVIYCESEFPLLEFSDHLLRWTRGGGRNDFVYTSLESDVPGLLCFTSHGDGRWRVHSAFQKKEAPRLVSSEEILHAARGYFADLRKALPSSIDASVYLPDEA